MKNWNRFRKNLLGYFQVSGYEEENQGRLLSEK
jgi:hypothetical protein